jgi:hypothetical protein
MKSSDGVDFGRGIDWLPQPLHNHFARLIGILVGNVPEFLKNPRRVFGTTEYNRN